MKHRIIPTMICDFICGAFFTCCQSTVLKKVYAIVMQLANDTGEIGG